jgi:primosomal protein N' (replication factor Y)
VKQNGRFLAQTFSPKEKIFDYLDQENYSKFHEDEVKLRKKLFYPPFSKLIKLSCRDNSKKKAEKEARKIFDLLEEAGDNRIEISDPYEPSAPKKRGYFYKNILIKVPRGKKLEKLPLRSIIGSLKKGWAVDVDPISTI